jgi:hypothetical protein
MPTPSQITNAIRRLNKTKNSTFTFTEFRTLAQSLGYSTPLLNQETSRVTSPEAQIELMRIYTDINRIYRQAPSAVKFYIKQESYGENMIFSTDTSVKVKALKARANRNLKAASQY